MRQKKRQNGDQKEAKKERKKMIKTHYKKGSIKKATEKRRQIGPKRMRQKWYTKIRTKGEVYKNGRKIG